MRRTTEFFLTLLLMWECVSGCGSSQSSSESASQPRTLTAEACEASGGTVVGDIGDGAIHRPDYRCPSGSPPSGTIRAAEGAPMAVEGSVCCPK